MPTLSTLVVMSAEPSASPVQVTGEPSAPRTAPAVGGPRMPVRLAPGAVAPHRAHEDDAGFDLVSTETMEIPAGGRALVGTGVSLALPTGTVGLVCPRSGLAVRHGITVLNGPGIVDAGYRGEIRVALHNTDPSEPFMVRAGDRIAQLVVVPFAAPELVEVDDLDATTRSHAGFGSSGGFGTAAPDQTRREV